MDTFTLTVTGMSCMGCVNSVRNLLSTIPGVHGIDIELASGRVTVTCQAGQVELQALQQAILDGGYGIAA